MNIGVARGSGAHLAVGAFFAFTLLVLLNIEPAWATVVEVQYSGVVTDTGLPGGLVATPNNPGVGDTFTATYVFMTGGATETNIPGAEDSIGHHASDTSANPGLIAFMTIGGNTVGALLPTTEFTATEITAAAENVSLGGISLRAGTSTSPNGQQDVSLGSSVLTNNLFPQNPTNFNSPLSYIVLPSDAGNTSWNFNQQAFGSGTNTLVTVAQNSTAQILTRQGGAASNPVNLTGPDIVQVNGAIGGQGTGQFYNLAWTGGQLIASADVNGADPLATYAFEILGPDGTVLETIELDSEDNFFGLLADQLAAGDYEIGLLSDSAFDPNFSITFGTPVDGVNAGVAAVPEPASLALFGAVVLAFGFLRRSRIV